MGTKSIKSKRKKGFSFRQSWNPGGQIIHCFIKYCFWWNYYPWAAILIAQSKMCLRAKNTTIYIKYQLVAFTALYPSQSLNCMVALIPTVLYSVSSYTEVLFVWPTDKQLSVTEQRLQHIAKLLSVHFWLNCPCLPVTRRGVSRVVNQGFKWGGELWVNTFLGYRWCEHVLWIWESCSRVTSDMYNTS